MCESQVLILKELQRADTVAYFRTDVNNPLARFEAQVAQLAALEAGELLALVRHLRPRLVPGEEPPASAVAEGIAQMGAGELRALARRLRERLAAEA